jgi:predicted kinase
MRHRLETRLHDASEATVDVLERQLDWVEPLAADETALCIPMLDPEQGRFRPGA